MVRLFSISVLFLAFSLNLLAAIPNEQMIHENLYRGGRPEMSDIDRLAEQNFKLIINFEDDAKAVAAEKKYAEQKGIRFLSFPMNAWETPNDEAVNEILKILVSTKKEKVFIHCKHGRDRTGLMSALYRVLVQKWNSQDAYSEMIDLGFRKLFKNMEKYYWKKVGG